LRNLQAAHFQNITARLVGIDSDFETPEAQCVLKKRRLENWRVD
jgi:hypothetical protein